MKIKGRHNLKSTAYTALLLTLYLSLSTSAEAFLGMTRGEVKERLGDPASRIIEINGLKYIADKYVYIIRYDAAGSVDRCMIAKLGESKSFTIQEFNDIVKSIPIKDLKVHNADSFFMIDEKTGYVYHALRYGTINEWVVMLTTEAGQLPDVSFFNSIMSILTNSK